MGSPATTCTSSIARCRDTIPLSGGGTSPLVSYVETQARRSPRAPREGTQNQTELARRCRTGNSPCPTATCEPSTPRPTGATVTQPIPTHQPKPQYNTLIAKPPTKHLTKFPLRWFAAPVEQVCAGEHELVAVVAVQVPGTGAAVDDGLEGAEPALGRGAAARQVDRQRLGLLAGERDGVPGQQFSGPGGAGTGDPDVLEHVLQIGAG